MNKKFFLSVFLLGALTLSSGVLTSCIDNDEPEGITTLRSAKAELLRAKAAVELAKVEAEKQRALLIAAKAEVQKAEAEVKKAEAEKAKADAAYREAEAEQEQAKADSLKALAEQKKAEVEAEIARIKAQLEITLMNLQTNLANAQQTYNNTLAEIEAAKAVLTPGQADKLGKLKKAVEEAWIGLADKQNAVLTAMNNVFDSTNNHADSVQLLQNQVIDAKAKLIAVNAAHDELTKLANSVSITAWEARRDSLEAYVGNDSIRGTASLDSNILALKKIEIMQTPEYKAKATEDSLARKEYVLAQMKYNYLTNGGKYNQYLTDCFEPGTAHSGHKDYLADKFGYEESGTHPTTSARTSAKKYDFDGVIIPIENENVINKIKAINPYLLASDPSWGTGFAINGLYADWGSGVTYSYFEYAFNTWGYDTFDLSLTVSAWKETLNKVTFTDEELAADECQKDYEKAIEKAQENHDKNVAAWKKAHKAYSEGKVEQTVSTATFAADIKKYNDNIDALEAAVTAYNTAYDNTVTALYNKHIEKQKISFATTEINTVIASVGSVGTRETLAQIDALIASSTLSASAQANMRNDYRTAMNNMWNSQSVTDVQNAQNTAMTEAQANAANEDAVKEALKVITNSDSDKPGLEEKLKLPATPNPENSKGKYSNGSYNSIGDAVNVFVEAAEANCEKLKDAANSNANAIASYTGVAAAADKKTYIDGGTKENPHYGDVTTSDWVKAKMELDDTDNYVNKGHKQVVRTKISDANVTKMATVEFDATKAEANWKSTSAAAFGTDAANARHTELTADLVTKVGVNYYDENNNQLPTYESRPSTLYSLVAAKEALADHEALAAGAEDLAAVKKAVAAYETSLKAKIAEYKKAIDEAYAAIEPAKKAHQTAHQAAAKLVADVNAEITAVNGKKAELEEIKGQLDKIITAYYSNQEFSYVDENDSIVSKRPEDVEALKEWINKELKQYEKKDSTFNPTQSDPYYPYYPESQGKIKDAEYLVSFAQNALDRFIADGEFDLVALDQLALEQAQQELAVAQTYYDYTLAQLHAYLVALGLE